MEEIWKDIENYKGYYQVSNLGRVKGLDRTNEIHRGKQKFYSRVRGKILKPIVNRQGYLSVELKGKSKLIHRLVAQAFIANPNNKKEVNHKDNNKSNNQIDNLEWVTPSENIKHAIKIGVHFLALGEKNGNAKITNKIAHIIKNYPICKNINKTIAEKFCISPNLVRRIRHNKSWKHIEGGVCE